MDLRLVTGTRAVRDFDFTDEPVGPLTAVAQRAVLWSVGTELGFDDADAPKVAAAVIERYRDLIDALAAAGVPWLQKYNRRMLCMNCMPAMVSVEGWPALRCGLQFCPWCHGREVERLAAAVGLDDAGLRASLYRDGTIFTGGQTRFLSASGAGDLPGVLATEAAACRVFSRGHQGLLTALHWAVDADPQPIPDGPPGWRIQTRVLGVRPVGRPLSLHPRGWSLVDGDRPGPDDLARAVCQAASYPLGYLLGPVPLLVQALAARDGLRLAEVSGAFRQRGGVGAGRGRTPGAG
jgi:hypothetical protein